MNECPSCGKIEGKNPPGVLARSMVECSECSALRLGENIKKAMTPAKEGLLPCPHCNKEAVVKSLFNRFKIGCETLGCRGNVGTSPLYAMSFNAIRFWNTHAPSAPKAEPPKPGHCTLCGTPVKVVSDGEGTSHYEPVGVPYNEGGGMIDAIKYLQILREELAKENLPNKAFEFLCRHPWAVHKDILIRVDERMKESV